MILTSLTYMKLSLNQYTLKIDPCCYEKKLIYKNIFFIKTMVMLKKGNTFLKHISLPFFVVICDQGRTAVVICVFKIGIRCPLIWFHLKFE